MAKFHINPEKGPRLCSAREGQCPYGSEAPHFATAEAAQEDFEEMLSKENKPLKSLKRPRHDLQLRKESFLKNFDAMDYFQIHDFSNFSKENHQIIDSIILVRSKESYEKFLKIQALNPANDSSGDKCDVTTYRSLVRDYNADRDRTAELVEAYTESEHYTPNALQLEDPSRVGRAYRASGFEPNSADWLRSRFDTVGGSDVGALAVMDFTPKEDLKFYNQRSLDRAESSKTALPTDEEITMSQNLSRGSKEGPLYRGTVWEKRIRDQYAVDHPEIKVYDTKDQFINIDRSWQKVNLDGVLSDRPDGVPNGIFEAKTGSDAKAWSNGVPIAYRAQTLYYLNATGLEFADIRAYHNDQETVEYRLYADDEVAVGSGVNMEQYIENRVSPWFEELKSRRALLAA